MDTRTSGRSPKEMDNCMISCYHSTVRFRRLDTSFPASPHTGPVIRSLAKCERHAIRSNANSATPVSLASDLNSRGKFQASEEAKLRLIDLDGNCYQ